MKQYFKRFSRLENDRCIAETGNFFDWVASRNPGCLIFSPVFSFKLKSSFINYSSSSQK